MNRLPHLIRFVRLWLAWALVRSMGMGIYDREKVHDAAGAAWRLGIYARHSGHLTNRVKAGGRVKRAAAHILELLEAA
jgi:hypothetical protein